MISFIIKALIALVGLGSAAFFLVIGLTNRSRSYVRSGWMVGLGTVGVVAAIAIVEYFLMN